MLLAFGFPAEAQQQKKVYRIGYLSSTDPAADAPLAGGYRAALRELGYIEGQNIAIEYRYAEGKLDRLPDLGRRRGYGDSASEKCDQNDSPHPDRVRV